MSEFKVDKLGYYKKRNGDIGKVVHFNKDGSILVINVGEDEYYRSYYAGGKYLWSQETERDLIEYLGEELPKPREFKFEAYLGEWQGAKYKNEEDTLDIVFGHGVTSKLYKTKKEIEDYLSSVDKISKWEIYMKEIVD